MSYDGWQDALTKAHRYAQDAERVGLNYERRREENALLAQMWASIAVAEANEPPLPVMDKAVRFSKPGGILQPVRDLQVNDSVVGARCPVCKHFVDNHGASGSCRECLCNGPKDVA